MSKKPSQDYDPMSYGEIRLGTGEGAGKATGDPDEILFDDTPPASPSMTFGDVANAFTDSDSPGGTTPGRDDPEPEYLGSGSPLMTGPEPPAPFDHGRENPSPEQILTGADEAVAPPPAAAPDPELETQRSPRSKPKSKPKRRSHERPAGPRSHPHRIPIPEVERGRSLSVPVALAVLATGLGSGALFYFGQGNPVLGGVSAAMGLVGSLFSLILLRR